jgi:hypothetical protein
MPRFDTSFVFGANTAPKAKKPKKTGGRKRTSGKTRTGKRRAGAAFGS